MDILSRLKLLNALMALTSPAVFPVRSFTAKGICVHEPIQGFNLNRRSISGLEPEMPVTILRTEAPNKLNFLLKSIKRIPYNDFFFY